MLASLGVREAFLSTASRWKSAELPSATAIFFPRSSATEWMGEFFGTTTAAARGLPAQRPHDRYLIARGGGEDRRRVADAADVE